ncbi:hypothetical protein BU25DRAFT_485241 [Macroventuria anomochaeta]|uniref:Uncharacterized protein n=1 Tax=Macroventuria anomochaeta TaxID=301207 RepID=A0ACB6S726_9PLEO|nr:uncharacterized protein BU25DRAFT_485241 [Macroventuria anomochaeta]KAF2630060.1 hypothetical protein BU25DRAFT_485241 [Macroventuria anomochaeta]
MKPQWASARSDPRTVDLSDEMPELFETYSHTSFYDYLPGRYKEFASTGGLHSRDPIEQKIAIAQGFPSRGPSENSPDKSGHSAGGAVAQIFYAMSMSCLYNVADATTGFKQVHCITFGTRPLASVALHDQQLGQRPKPGRFWSVISEGDPVPQAQEEFLKNLIEVYVLKRSDLKNRYPGDVTIPGGHFRASGKKDGVGAYTTLSSTLETKLFGNAFAHSCELYK